MKIPEGGRIKVVGILGGTTKIEEKQGFPENMENSRRVTVNLTGNPGLVNRGVQFFFWKSPFLARKERKRKTYVYLELTYKAP